MTAIFLRGFGEQFNYYDFCSWTHRVCQILSSDPKDLCTTECFLRLFLQSLYTNPLGHWQTFGIVKIYLFIVIKFFEQNFCRQILLTKAF